MMADRSPAATLAEMVTAAANQATGNAEALAAADIKARQLAAFLDALDVLPAAKDAETAAALRNARNLVESIQAVTFAVMGDAMRASLLLLEAAEALTDAPA